MNRGGFSWRRFIGYSAFKGRVGRKIGVPLTESGRNQKIGRAVTKNLWWIVLVFIALLARSCG
jgi:hypothetical protein